MLFRSWVVAQGSADDTMDYWQTNNMGLAGGMGYSPSSGWNPISTVYYGGQVLPAFNIRGNPSFILLSPTVTVAKTHTGNFTLGTERGDVQRDGVERGLGGPDQRYGDGDGDRAGRNDTRVDGGDRVDLSSRRDDVHAE